MKQILIPGFFCFLFMCFGCQSKTQPDFTKLKWTTVDSSFAYYISNTGSNNPASPDDSLEVKLLGYLHDSALQLRFTRVILDDQLRYGGVLQNQLKDLFYQKLSPHAEGYLRYDIYQGMTKSINLRAYLKTNAEQHKVDSFVKQLNNYPNVQYAHYISKEEALQLYIADGNPDFKNVLNENPLPASVEIKLKRVSSKSELLAIAQDIKKLYVEGISEVIYPELLEEALKDKSLWFGLRGGDS